MANLFVLAFENEDGASSALKEIESLKKQELIEVDDAAVAIHRQDGKVKIRQAKSLAGAGALGGAFWGMLFGLIFFIPFVGIALGAATGALLGKASDYGIDDKFIKSASEKITPGTSALFLLVHSAQKEKVIDALRPFGGELIQSSLSPKQESELKEALAV